MKKVSLSLIISIVFVTPAFAVDNKDAAYNGLSLQKLSMGEKSQTDCKHTLRHFVLSEKSGIRELKSFCFTDDKEREAFLKGKNAAYLEEQIKIADTNFAKLANK